MSGHEHWFEQVADHLGSAYLRYSFTKGTGNEVGFLCGALGLRAPARILDVGCGPGRHAHALARLGFEVVGVDISERFVALANEAAPAGATFHRLDARSLPFDSEFDAAISLCQGAFGLQGGPAADPVDPLTPDLDVLTGMARALRPGGRLALSAFSSYFLIRYLEGTDSFDAATGVNHEHTSVRDENGVEADADLWTGCFTPRELRLLARSVGLTVLGVHSVSPGAYSPSPPDLDHPEFLLIARRP